MNIESSRSHALFTVTIECSERIGERNHITQGKLQLVDLAVCFLYFLHFPVLFTVSKARKFSRSLNYDCFIEHAAESNLCNS